LCKDEIQGADAIKGPIFRIKLDVRRVWRCPQCGTVRKTHGSVVVQECDRCEGTVRMQLVESARPEMMACPTQDTTSLEPADPSTAAESDPGADAGGPLVSAVSTEMAAPEIAAGTCSDKADAESERAGEGSPSTSPSDLSADERADPQATTPPGEPRKGKRRHRGRKKAKRRKKYRSGGKRAPSDAAGSSTPQASASRPNPGDPTGAKG